jgi:hypothetical protein
VEGLVGQNPDSRRNKRRSLKLAFISGQAVPLELAVALILALMEATLWQE